MVTQWVQADSPLDRVLLRRNVKAKNCRTGNSSGDAPPGGAQSGKGGVQGRKWSVFDHDGA